MTTPLRTQCAACAHPTLEVFLDLGQTPLANKFPTEAELGQEKWYALQLGRCTSCGLVQNMAIIADSEIYGDDYGFFSGGSQTQLAYHLSGARLLTDRYLSDSSLLNPLVVEIACNDGAMLQHFANWGFRTLGIDPAGPADVAIAAGLNVLKEPFTYALAQTLRAEQGPADLVIAYNSLAHIENLADVLAGIRVLLADDGVAVVEVQYLPDLLAGNFYDQVYHEHRYFHSLSSFKRAAELHGLYVADAELIELQNGGIRITLSLDPNRQITNEPATILHNEQWLQIDGVYAGVQGRIDRIRDHLTQLLSIEISAGHSLAGYAAAAKATTILNFCGLKSNTLPVVVDTTEYKQGRFVPGTGIPIVSPDNSYVDRVDTFLLLAPNYIGTALRTYPKARWIQPIPSPVII